MSLGWARYGSSGQEGQSKEAQAAASAALMNAYAAYTEALKKAGDSSSEVSAEA
ncbi:hypothetical protein [Pseudomonas oryzihabitans]|uniref:hypothetical protein n=1 Tax=Pseudomonas oryzihabitans TaxID=47885 RepID=UPI0028940223|nr:hypothetical protein [Pseudomonas oryzihabitans]MDT3719046.1 hypothetical protein [Pseudomonas oryzihabitans]